MLAIIIKMCIIKSIEGMNTCKYGKEKGLMQFQLPQIKYLLQVVEKCIGDLS